MKINVACGSSISKGWVNIDFAPSSGDVRQVNLLNGLPFSENSADVIYASHFLEHLTPEMGGRFLCESARVLRTGGRIRLVVPDLEEICAAYLTYRQSNQHKFADFVAIELIDQCVRMKSGGKLAQTYQQIKRTGDVEMIDFVYHRTGHDLNAALSQHSSLNEKLKHISWGKLKSFLQYQYVRMVALLLPKAIRDQVVSTAMIGEKHLWVYDFKMLSDLLASAGFTEIQKMKFDQSGIERFYSDCLDQDALGNPRKGHESMYVEATKK